MSNSRSNAAAINRRAGNIVQQRPNTQQQQAPVGFNPKTPVQSQPPQTNPKNVRFVPSGQGLPPPPPNNSSAQPRYFQQPTIPVKTAGVNGPVGQVSISDAFALVTIRLGRVEQFIQQLQEEGLESLGISTSDNQNENNGSTAVLDLQNTLKENEKTILGLTQKIDSYESTIQNMKDMLLTLTMKNEKNSIETSVIFNKFEENMKSIEINVNGLVEKHDYLQNQLQTSFVETPLEISDDINEEKNEILEIEVETVSETETEE